jgi:hypothetical protein
MIDEGRILMVTVGAIVIITVVGIVAEMVKHSNAVEACTAAGGVYANLRGVESCLSPDIFIKVK